MGKPILEVVVPYLENPQVILTVSTDSDSIVLWTGRNWSLGDQTWREHYTYHRDGTLHITEEDPKRHVPLLPPPPPWETLTYQRIALIPVPMAPSSQTRSHRQSDVPKLMIPPPTNGEGTLAVGVLGPNGSPESVERSGSDGALLKLVPGPEGTRIVLCYFAPPQT